MAKLKKTVIVAALDGDFQRKVWTYYKILNQKFMIWFDLRVFVWKRKKDFQWRLVTRDNSIRIAQVEFTHDDLHEINVT